MITHTRRTFYLLAVLTGVMLAAAACGNTSDIPDRPVVKIQVGETTYEEDVYSYCWPEAEDNLACDLDAAALAQPETIVDVSGTDEVRFVIDGEADPPVRFTAALLDGPGGVQNLGTGTEAVYPVGLQDGLYRVQVNAEYADIEGQPGYVSYVFGLNVTGAAVAVASTPTPTASTTPTEAATETPTVTLTAIATATTAPTLTATATALPTEAPTEEAEVTEAPTKEAAMTEAPTEEAAMTEEVEETEEAEVSATPADEEETPVVEASATPTRIRPSSTPTPTQTARPSATPLPTLIPQPTTAPTLTPDTGTGPAVEDVPEVPALSLNFGGRIYEPVGYQYCQRAASGERVCVEQPQPGTSTRSISLLRGAAAQIMVTGPRPDEVRIEYLTESGVPTGQPELRPGDNITLLTVLPEPGAYILAVRVQWTEEDATYFFRVAVSD
jgi:hypothetical protein